MGVRDEIVAYCRENIGCSYDWTPSGGVEGQSYNCSYLSTCAYAAAGIEIPSWQGHQNGDGSQSDWVRWADHWTDDPDELLPGDLVFFGDEPGNTFHVGVSLGGDRMIDSVPSGGVQERSLYYTFVGGGWPLDLLPEEEIAPAEDDREGAMLACIIDIKDDHAGYEAGMQVLWTPMGFEYVNHPDCLVVLDQISEYYCGKPLKRVESSAAAPWVARLQQVTIAPGDQTEGTVR